MKGDLFLFMADSDYIFPEDIKDYQRKDICIATQQRILETVNNNKKLIDQRINAIETDLQSLEEGLDHVKYLNDLLIELRTIVRQTSETNEKRDKEISRQNSQMIKLSENLITITNSLENLNSQMKTSKDSIEELNSKVDKVNENDNISVTGIVKNGILLLITMVATALFTLVISGKL